jgi:uncharacterized protein YjlB
MWPGVESYPLRDDGVVPNNPRLPLVLYRAAIAGAGATDAANRVESLFRNHGWRGVWVDGIYSFHHYHALSHEVLGIALGTARVQFGGASGPVFDLTAGDAAAIPAGVAHCCLEAHVDLCVVGAYPAGQENWDMKRDTEAQRDAALAQIPTVRLPAQDPIFGVAGPLLALWR